MLQIQSHSDRQYLKDLKIHTKQFYKVGVFCCCTLYEKIKAWRGSPSSHSHVIPLLSHLFCSSQGLTRPNAKVLTTLPVSPIVGTERPLWGRREQSAQREEDALSLTR
jgi:hypothetical protein